MTRDEAKALLPVIKAFADGRAIQWKSDAGWRDDNGDVSFSKFPTSYRIKPEPKLRPWKASEVPMGAIVRKIGDDKNCAMITGRRDGCVKFGLWDGSFSDYFGGFKDMWKEFEHSTDGGKSWLPCGILEEA